MCLAIPGQLEELIEGPGAKMGKVNFGGIKKAVCLEYTPEALVGNYVLVHVGFAISIIDLEEAARAFSMLKGSTELSELVE